MKFIFCNDVPIDYKAACFSDFIYKTEYILLKRCKNKDIQSCSKLAHAYNYAWLCALSYIKSDIDSFYLKYEQSHTYDTDDEEYKSYRKDIKEYNDKILKVYDIMEFHASVYEPNDCYSMVNQKKYCMSKSKYLNRACDGGIQTHAMMLGGSKSLTYSNYCHGR